jgi:hypothetical protein
MADPGAVHWARKVQTYEPHGLADLENILLSDKPQNRERLRYGLRMGARRRLREMLITLMMVGPLLGPVAFTEGRYRGMARTYQPEVAYPLAAVGCAAGVVVLGVLLSRWWRGDRVRDPLTLTLAVLFGLSAAATLKLAHDLSTSLDENPTAYVAPAWVLLGAAVLTVIHQSLNASNPVRQRFRVEFLHRDDRAMLLRERSTALAILSERGMLDGHNPEVLDARPLGALHLSQGNVT